MYIAGPSTVEPHSSGLQTSLNRAGSGKNLMNKKWVGHVYLHMRIGFIVQMH